MNSNNAEKYRNKSLDFLKIVLMFFIITHHLLIRRYGLRDLTIGTFEVKNSIFLFVNSFLVVSVNVFFLISGFFGIKKNILKIIKLVVSVYFFYWLINILSILFKIQKMNVEVIKGLIFPVSQYWFILVYVVLSMIGPYIKSGLAILEIEKQKMLIYMLLFVWCGYAFLIDNEVLGANRGYSLIFAIVLYIIGDYLYKKRTLISSRYLFVWYGVLSGVNGILILISVFTINNQKLAWKLYSYNNPLVLFASICLFLSFSKISFKMPYFFSRLSKYTLPVYIVHSTPVFADCYMQFLEKFTFFGRFVQSIIFCGCVVFLFVAGVALGKLYEFLWRFVEYSVVKVLNELRKILT